MPDSTLNYLTLAETARRLGECQNTLRRAVKRTAMNGDACLMERGKKIPIFLEARLPLLKQLIEGKKNNE
jgi:hypothetical protein